MNANAESLCERYRAGDASAAGPLLESVRPQARYLARRYASRPADAEDVEAEALVAALDAASTFDPSKGARFATWAFRLMRRAAGRAARTLEKQRSREVTLASWDNVA